MKRKRILLYFLLFVFSGCSSEEAILTPEFAEDSVVEEFSTSTIMPIETLLPTLFPSTPTESPTHTPTPLVCLTEGGETFNDWIESDLLVNLFEFRVYLPPCYEHNEARRYPVLYLVHGQTFKHDQWDRLGVDEIADRMISFGGSEPFIMVMPRDRVWTQPSEDNFGEAVLHDLIPYIDVTYRTIAEREYRGVGGISRGASWALHLGIGHWELFGIIGLHSLPVFWEDAPKVPGWLDEIPPEQYPRIYLDVASRDEEAIEDSAGWFVEQLKKRNIPFEWHLYVGFHEEVYWQENMENYMRFYTRGW